MERLPTVGRASWVKTPSNSSPKLWTPCFFLLLCFLYGSQGTAADYQFNLSSKFGIPYPWELAAEARSNNFAFYVSGTPIGVSFNIDSVAVKNRSIAAGFSYGFPFYGTLAFGRQILGATKTDTITVDLLGTPTPITATADATIKSWSIRPAVGYVWNLSTRWALNLELGAVIVFSPETTLEASSEDALANTVLEAVEQTSDYKALERAARDVGNRIGRYTLPYLSVSIAFSLN